VASPAYPPTGTGPLVNYSYMVLVLILIVSLVLNSDAPDVYGSTFFKDLDPESGLGGWGDPANDFQVPTGG